MLISFMTSSDALSERLKTRAAQNHRTPEEEARVILEQALVAEQRSAKGPEAVAAEIRKLGLRTPSDSVEIIRAFRDR